MPKISFYENNELVYNNDPKTWAWEYPTKIQDINTEYVLGVNLSTTKTNFMIYGLFKKDHLTSNILNESNVVSAAEIEECPGIQFNIPEIKKVCVIHMVATSLDERGKGLAKILYAWLLEKYKIVLSDKEVFTDTGKESRTLSIWKNHLSTLGTLLNYNTKTMQYTNFDPSDNSEDTRFVVVQNRKIAESMLESFSNWMKNGVNKAALTSILSLPLVSAGGKPEVKPEVVPYPPKMELPASSPRADGKSPLAPYDHETPTEDDNKEESIVIDVDIIADLESGSNKHQGRNHKGATGICQLKKPAWNEAVISLYGKSGLSKYPFYKYATNHVINKRISDQYYNVVLPKHLTAYDLPVTKETLLAAYNAGSYNVKKAIQRYGKNWLRGMPAETRSYVERYKNIENSD